MDGRSYLHDKWGNVQLNIKIELYDIWSKKRTTQSNVKCKTKQKMKKKPTIAQYQR